MDEELIYFTFLDKLLPVFMVRSPFDANRSRSVTIAVCQSLMFALTVYVAAESSIPLFSLDLTLPNLLTIFSIEITIFRTTILIFTYYWMLQKQSSQLSKCLNRVNISVESTPVVKRSVVRLLYLAVIVLKVLFQEGVAIYSIFKHERLSLALNLIYGTTFIEALFLEFLVLMIMIKTKYEQLTEKVISSDLTGKTGNDRRQAVNKIVIDCRLINDALMAVKNLERCFINIFRTTTMILVLCDSYAVWSFSNLELRYVKHLLTHFTRIILMETSMITLRTQVSSYLALQFKFCSTLIFI